jgi:carboxyl-terminal processing protease
VTGVLLSTACSGGPPAAPAVQPATPTASASQETGPDLPAFPEVVPPDKPLEPPSEVPPELKIIWEVWALLAREHIDREKLDPKAFSEAAVRGMLEALGDPHTGYVNPESFDIESGDLQGKFEGIGANVSMRRDGKLLIVAPIKGSPAEAAGVRPGDIILSVDGKSIEGLSLLEAVSMIRGPRGSKVRLLVQHLGDIDPVEIEVLRDVIPLVSVLVRSQPGDRLAHIRVTNFYADTSEKLNQAIREATASGAKGLIIDVRDNPGGLLSSAVDVTSTFLKDGLVLSEVDASGRRNNWNVRRGGVAADIPMVVLANQGSASASEILVGAIQDHKRATVIGAKTFGKGSVNILRRLSNNGGLYMTVARWYTPAGRLIEGNGLVPDVEVDSIDRQKAEIMQLEKAMEVLESLIAAKESEKSSA